MSISLTLGSIIHYTYRGKSTVCRLGLESGVQYNSGYIRRNVPFDFYVGTRSL